MSPDKNQGTAIRPESDRVTVERVYPTTPERLFKAWTDPAITCRFMAPGPMTCRLPVYEARKGGRFRVEMSGPGPDGTPFTMVQEGRFVEVTPPTRIVMEWPGADPEDPKAPNTLVTIDITAVAGGTRLRLVHERFPNAEHAGHAGGGWGSAFDKLAGLV